MPALSYDTQVTQAAQLQQLQAQLSSSDLDDEWLTQVMPRLPANIQEQSCALGALQRKRGLQSASDLLRALLCYVLCVSSFRQLGAWAVLVGLADISEAAWRKRLRCANTWLLWLLGELLATPTPTPTPTLPLRRRILLVDATTMSHPGGAGDEWRVHTSYNLQTERLTHVTVGDRHSGEHLGHYQLQSGDIVVADNGYGYRRSVAIATAVHADVVLRINLGSFPLQTEDGHPFEVGSWLHSGKGRYRRKGRVAYCWHEGIRYQVRVVAVRLSPEAARKARQRKERCAQKHGYKATAASLAVAGWVILVTTLPQQEWSDEAVLRLYRSRWQIELVFKRMKGILCLDEVRLKERVGVEAVVRLKLIGWALQEEEAHMLKGVLRQLQEAILVEREGVVGVWLLTRLGMQTLRQQVERGWTMASLIDCLPMLRRYLCGSARGRPHQLTEIQAWLHRLNKPLNQLTDQLTTAPNFLQPVA